jgi:ATP-binding cassette subfamily G (WHITE) protein 2 (SNQ2)
MTGLDVDVSKFWIYVLFIFTTTFCITALYRMFASLSPTIDDAVRFSGLALNLLMWVTSVEMRLLILC